jgi:hypothetical protein
MSRTLAPVTAPRIASQVRRLEDSPAPQELAPQKISAHKPFQPRLDLFPFGLPQAAPLRHLSPVGRGRIGEREPRRSG